MRKKILMSSVILGSCLLGVFSLTAAKNRIEIVDQNYATKQLSNDGMHITNSIDTSITDLVNGEVAIDITIDNSKHAEVFYIIDNSQTAKNVKENIIEAFKKGAKALEGFSNFKQGVVTTTDSNISFIELDNKNIESQLDSIKSIEASANAESEIFTSIDKAAENYSENINLKYMIISLSSVPSTDIAALKNKINEYSEKGIKFIVYGVDLSNKSNFQNIFDKATRYEITNDGIKDIEFVANVHADLPQIKPGIATTISFDNYILENFTIKDIKTNLGVAHFDDNTKQIIWEAGDINTNQVARLTYYLSLNKVVDENLVEKIKMKTNRQIKVTQMGQLIGQYPADDVINDQVCSPTIRILREAVDNPKTGIANFIVFGSCMLAVAAITIIVLNRKSQFNRI